MVPYYVTYHQHMFRSPEFTQVINISSTHISSTHFSVTWVNSCDRLLSVFVCHPSCVNNYTFLTSSWKLLIELLPFFYVSHLYGKRNINCDMYGTQAKIAKKRDANFSKISFSTPTHVRKNWLHDNDVDEAHYQNWEIHGPWVRG